MPDTIGRFVKPSGLERHGISRLPDVQGDRPGKRKFKSHPIGCFHTEIAEVGTERGKLRILVALDRTPGPYTWRSASRRRVGLEPEAVSELASHKILPNRSSRQGSDMPNLDVERAHLAKADQDIADGERRVSAQLLLIERLRGEGHVTDDAEGLLQTLQQTLQAWRDHRNLIIGTIARLEQMPPPQHQVRKAGSP